MNTTTDKLALFKYDPSTDGAQTFNIKKALNDNWDKLDDAVKEILITLQNKAPLTKTIAMLGDMPSKIAVKDAGWYRAIKITDPLAGYIVHIGHSYNSGGASDLLAYVHPYSVNPQVVILTSSKRPQSSGMIIDDLRITQVGSSHTYYLDIHYLGTTGPNSIFLDAIASVQPDIEARSATKIMDLSAVADSPDGETVIATAEWQSPPMALGVEYRTTERFLGKPLYTKMVDFGALPNNTYKDVGAVPGSKPFYGFIDLAHSHIDIDPMNRSNWIPLHENITQFWFRLGDIRIGTNTDLSNYHAYICVKYTKPTD